MENLIILSKDNAFGSMDNGTKRDVQINKNSLIYELKKYFKWRNPTKAYNCIIERFYGLGSSDYDKFINYLIKIGY